MYFSQAFWKSLKLKVTLGVTLEGLLFSLICSFLNNSGSSLLCCCVSCKLTVCVYEVHFMLNKLYELLCNLITR